VRFAIFGGSNDNFGTADTYAFLASSHAIDWSTTEAQRQIKLTEDVVITGMTFLPTTAPGVGNTRTFTVRKNGVDTGVTLTISGTDTSGTFSGSVAFADGDLISLKASSTGTPAAPGNTYWHLTLNTTGQKALLMGGCAGTPSTTVTQYTNPFGASNWSGTSAVLDVPVACPGNVTKSAFVTSAAPGAGKSFAFSLRLNAATDALTATVADANTSATATGSQALVAGDNIQMKSVPAGTPTAGVVGWCLTFEPATDGETFTGYGSSAAPSTTATHFEQPLGVGLNGWNASSGGRRVRPPACDIKDVQVRLSAAPGIGSSRTIRLGYDAVTTHTVTITDLATTGVDTTSAAIPADGGAAGLILASAVPAIPPAACNVHVGYALVFPQLEEHSGTGSLTAAATLTASGVADRAGTTSVTATATIAGSGVAARSGAATISAASAISGTGVAARAGAGTLAAAAALAATGIAARAGSAALTATASATAAGITARTGSGTLTAAAALTGVGASSGSRLDIDGPTATLVADGRRGATLTASARTVDLVDGGATSVTLT
jgi:hypothetical protein